jgi:hypothetical protein
MKTHALLGLICLSLLTPSLFGQTNTAADTNSVAASPVPVSQASDDVVKKLSNLVHDGKYAEAQQLASGLLLAYPGDQRLLKAKTLLDKLIAASNSSQPTNSVDQHAASGTSKQLAGMDKVDYNALIQRAREAQQTTDLDQQKILLKQFMDDSSQFLQKHPDQMLLWQFRAVSAIILDNMTDGYDAGQKLLAGGAVDSNDPNLQQLLAQLKNKGWLDKEKMVKHELFEDKQKKLGWLLGTWNVTWTWKVPDLTLLSCNRGSEEFSLSDSNIEGNEITSAGRKNPEPDLRGTILQSEEINWECYLPPSDQREFFIFRNWTTMSHYGIEAHWRSESGCYDDRGNIPNPPQGPFYPSGWQPVISCAIDKDHGIITIVMPSQWLDTKSKKPLKYPVTLTFTKIGDSHN